MSKGWIQEQDWSGIVKDRTPRRCIMSSRLDSQIPNPLELSGRPVVLYDLDY